MHRWVIVISTIILTLGFYSVAMAQVQVGSEDIDYRFGEYITFRSVLRSDSPIESVLLFIQREGNYDTISSPALIPQDGVVEYAIDPIQEKIRAFSTLQYWYEVTLTNGDSYATPKGSFYYDDNRFEWQTREKSPFEALWHEGDAAFGQNILNTAQQGLEQIKGLLPVANLDSVKIYTYANPADMRATLQIANRNWVGAHTDPDLLVMVVSLPSGPEQRLEMERQIPHELMHIVLYQKIGPSYVNLPAWFNEGLASIAELYPNPDYLKILKSAYEKENLFPIKDLCTPFPRDAAGAYLAYAQAASFTRFLHNEFGSSGLESLLLTYADGLDCERGIQVALGSDLNQLELAWRRDTFGQDPIATAATNLAPWIALLMAVLAVPALIVISSLRRRPESEKQSGSQGARTI
jgi:hypothetical protein